jgi:hypothetical protein
MAGFYIGARRIVWPVKVAHHERGSAVNKVADLTAVSAAHSPLSTTATGPAPTQELGAALYRSGLFEGFLAISAKMPWRMVLGVFPGRVGAGNFVRYSYVDSAGATQTLQFP